MDKPTLSTLIFEVTQACDHACLYCYNYWNHPQWQGRRLSLTTDVRPLLAQVLDQVECRHVTLTGGEPTLRSDLPKIVDFLAAREVSVTLISNGHHLTTDVISDLLQRGVRLFELPLLSFRREVHDRLSGAPGAFDAVLAALADIRYQRGQVVTAFIATRHNLPDLYDTLKLAFAFGVSGVMLNRFNPGGRGAAHLAELLPTVDELRAALEVAEATAREFQLPIACSIPIQPCLIDTERYPHLSFGFCAAGSSRAYYTLDTAGNVRPCNHTPTILGNVWRTSMTNILTSRQLAEFTKAIPGECAMCSLKAQCQGGCKASAQVCYGDLCAPEPFLQRNKSHLTLTTLPGG